MIESNFHVFFRHSTKLLAQNNNNKKDLFRWERLNFNSLAFLSLDTWHIKPTTGTMRTARTLTSMDISFPLRDKDSRFIIVIGPCTHKAIEDHRNLPISVCLIFNINYTLVH